MPSLSIDASLKSSYVDQSNPVSIMRDKFNEPHSMPSEHFHDHCEIYYLISGEKTYFFQNQMYRATKGDLVFINEYEPHRTASPGPVLERERVLLYFKKELFDARPELMRDSASLFRMRSPILSLDIPERLIFEELMYKIKMEFQLKGKFYLQCIEGLLLETMVFILRCIDKRKNEASEGGRSLHDQIPEIVRFIHRHFTDHLTLNNLSDMFYISPSYLSRLFKTATGFHFVEYITMLRMKEAQKLLRETDRQIIDIAGSVGYDNLAHFYKMFKKITLASPYRYRKMQQRRQ